MYALYPALYMAHRSQGNFALHFQKDLAEVNFFFLSDVWLDHPNTMHGLEMMLKNCADNDFIPKVMVLCGNFTSQSISQGSSRDIQRYQGTFIVRLSIFGTLFISFSERFEALADLLASYPVIVRNTHIILIPGPLDLAINSTLPRKPLLASVTAKLRSKVPKLHFGTNPCRIKFFHQEIVVFREDIMTKMLRNIIGIKPEVKGDDLKQYVCSISAPSEHFCNH